MDEQENTISLVELENMTSLTLEGEEGKVFLTPHSQLFLSKFKAAQKLFEKIEKAVKMQVMGEFAKYPLLKKFDGDSIAITKVERKGGYEAISDLKVLAEDPELKAFIKVETVYSIDTKALAEYQESKRKEIVKLKLEGVSEDDLPADLPEGFKEKDGSSYPLIKER